MYVSIFHNPRSVTFRKKPESEYFGFADHLVCVTAAQLCHCGMKPRVGNGWLPPKPKADGSSWLWPMGHIVSATRTLVIVMALSLQANVMLEYDIDEAQALLEKNLLTATKNLDSLEEDLDFLRDQFTTTEVSILSLKRNGEERRKMFLFLTFLLASLSWEECPYSLTHHSSLVPLAPFCSCPP